MNFLRIGTKASFAVRGLARSPLPRGLATVADNTIRITFVDQEVCNVHARPSGVYSPPFFVSRRVIE